MEQETTTGGGEMAMTPKRTLEASTSFIAGSVLLVIALAIAGLYAMNVNTPASDVTPTVSTAETSDAAQLSSFASTEAATAAATATLGTQSSSDELSAIEADLNSTDLTSLSGVSNI